MARVAYLVLLSLFLLGCPGSEAELTPPPAAPTPEAPPETAPEAGSKPVDPVTEAPKGPEGLDGSKDAEQAIGLMATSKDPVCGKDVSLNAAAPVTHEWGDTTYVFCGASCRDEFKTNPKAHVKKN
jgi:YHS domain-containing protein